VKHVRSATDAVGGRGPRAAQHRVRPFVCLRSMKSLFCLLHMMSRKCDDVKERPRRQPASNCDLYSVTSASQLVISRSKLQLSRDCLS